MNTATLLAELSNRCSLAVTSIPNQCIHGGCDGWINRMKPTISYFRIKSHFQWGLYKHGFDLMCHFWNLVATELTLFLLQTVCILSLFFYTITSTAQTLLLTIRTDLSLPAQGGSVKMAIQRGKDRERNQKMTLMPHGGFGAVTHECLPIDDLHQLSPWCRPLPWPRVTGTLAST